MYPLPYLTCFLFTYHTDCGLHVFLTPLPHTYSPTLLVSPFPKPPPYTPPPPPRHTFTALHLYLFVFSHYGHCHYLDIVITYYMPYLVPCTLCPTFPHPLWDTALGGIVQLPFIPTDGYLDMCLATPLPCFPLPCRFSLPCITPAFFLALSSRHLSVFCA